MPGLQHGSPHALQQPALYAGLGLTVAHTSRGVSLAVHRALSCFMSASGGKGQFALSATKSAQHWTVSRQRDAVLGQQAAAGRSHQQQEWLQDTPIVLQPQGLVNNSVFRKERGSASSGAHCRAEWDSSAPAAQKIRHCC